MTRRDGRLPGSDAPDLRWVPTALYAAFLVYGTLFPWQGWHVPEQDLSSLLRMLWPQRVSRSDVLTNVLVYLPLGFLAVRSRSPALRGRSSLWYALLVGTGLSGLLELTQAFLPTRTPSALDLVLNGSGSLVGAWGSRLVAPGEPLGKMLRDLRERWIIRGRAGNVGLAAIGLWAFSQLSPFVPSLDVGDWKSGLRPLWYTLRGTTQLDLWQTTAYLAAVLGLGLLARALTRAGRPSTRAFAIFVLSILVAKVPVVSRQLSAEALLGALGALAVLAVVQAVRMDASGGPASWGTALGIGAAFVAEQLRPGAVTTVVPTQAVMNWIPLSSHALDALDLADLLGSSWPFVGLAFLTRGVWGRLKAAGIWLGAGLVGVACLGLEAAQLAVPGRIADVTDALVSLLAWVVAARYLADDNLVTGQGEGSGRGRFDGAPCRDPRRSRMSKALDR